MKTFGTVLSVLGVIAGIVGIGIGVYGIAANIPAEGPLYAIDWLLVVGGPMTAFIGLELRDR